MTKKKHTESEKRSREFEKEIRVLAQNSNEVMPGLFLIPNLQIIEAESTSIDVSSDNPNSKER